MGYLGKYRIGDTLVIDAETTNSAGNPADADALPTFVLYEMADNLTLLEADFEKRDDADTVGQYQASVLLSAQAGYEWGKRYKVRKAALINGQTYVSQDWFQIEAASSPGSAPPVSGALNDLTNLILDEFDDEDHDMLLPVIYSGYTLYADKASIAPRLRYNYLVRRCIDRLLRTKYKDVDWGENGVNESLGQMARQLQQMREDINEEIAQIEKEARASRAPATGIIKRTATVMPENGEPDPNDPKFRGSPLRR